MKTSATLRRLALPLLLAAFLPASALAQTNFDEVQIQTIPVAEGLYMLMGAGGNIGLSVGDDGPFLIDDQYAPLTEKIVNAVAVQTAAPVRFVINTHWHGDHTGGNENFGNRGAVIVAHENVRARMSTEQFLEAFNSRTPASPPAALPVITFDDDVTMHLNGDEVHVFHVGAGHTDGDAVVHFKNANVVHMGDTFFNGFYPFVDPSSGGHIDGIIATADHVLALTDADTKIIPGHGPLSNRAELATYRYMLATLSARFHKMIGEGMSRDEVVAAKPTADFDEAWGGGFLEPDVWVGIIYDGIMARHTH